MIPRMSLHRSLPIAIVALIILPLALLSCVHYRVERDALQTRYLAQAEIAMGGLQRLVEAGLPVPSMDMFTQALASVEAFPSLSRAFGLDKDLRVILASNPVWNGKAIGEFDPLLATHWPTDAQPVVRLEAEGLRVAAYHPVTLRQAGELQGGWLFLELDLTAELHKQRLAITNQSLVAGMVVLLFSLLLWRWIAVSVSRPLTALTAAAGEMASGRRVSPVRSGGSAELAALTRAFNQMAEELAYRYEALTRQRVLYQTLSNTNQAILREQEEESLLARICEVAVEAGIKLVWIGYANQRAGSLSIVQSAGSETAWLETVRRHVGIESDPLAQAVKRGEELIVHIASDGQQNNHWYAEALLNGFAAGAALPIRRGDNWIGGLVVMSEDTGLFDEAGMTLLREMAADLGYALDSLDREALRRRMEQSLAGDRALLRTLIDSIPDMIFFKDRAQSYLGCNLAFEKLIAMHEDRLVGGTDQDLFSEQMAKLFNRQDREILLSGTSGRGEVWMEYPDGRKVLLDIVKTPYRGPDGRIMGLIGVGRDITAEFHAKESLKKTLEMLENAEQISHLGSWTYDPLAGRMHWSAVVYQILGYAEQSVEPAFELFLERCHADDRAVMARIGADMREGRIREFTHEHRIVTQQGETRHVIGRGRASGQGQDLTVIGTMQDITQRIRSEEERDRTLEAMRQAQKLEAIGELTGGVVHELNNLLAPILGFAELARQSDDLPRQKLRAYLESISESAVRGRDLIARLTAISHGDSMHNAVVQDLVPLVEESVQLMRATLPSGINITTHVDAALPEVLIDPEHLRQILMNLMINARDALGERGEIRLTLTCMPAPALHCSACGEPLEGDYLMLSVADNGSGIPEARINQLFDPFYTTKQTEEKRSGMGLAVVQGLLQHYKAHVVVESEPGKGSRFNLLFLPAGRQKSALKEERRSRLDGMPCLPGKRVMLVDDEPAIILFMTDFIEMQGLAVEAFTDSEQALARFRQAPESFDLLITDQAMPMINGLELVEQVHARRPGLPVILCSGYSDRINAVNAAEFGVYRFLEKPVSPEDLLAALAGALQLGRPPPGAG